MPACTCYLFCLQAPGGGDGSGDPCSSSQAVSPTLSEEQRIVLELVREGKNVFFTGRAQLLCPLDPCCQTALNVSSGCHDCQQRPQPRTRCMSCLFLGWDTNTSRYLTSSGLLPSMFVCTCRVQLCQPMSRHTLARAALPAPPTPPPPHPTPAHM